MAPILAVLPAFKHWVRRFCWVVGARLGAMVTSKARLSFYAIGPSTL